MKIRVNKEKNVTVLTVLDDVILDSVKDVQDTIQTIISQKSLFVIMNLSEIEFVTSRGIGVIGKTMDILRTNGGDLKLCGVKPELKKIFEICGLAKILDIHDTEEQALLSCGDNVGAVEKRLLWSINEK
jgi:stage II sporulation protein AA (anti-sigma F factor antagonist)